jgi:hypothetical protein
MIGGKNKKEKDENLKVEKEIEKIAKRREKILDLIELKNLVPRIIYPPNNIIDRILAALFYGYSINRASYTGLGKKYNVQFSSKKGSISKSSFEFIGTNPDYIIYEKFVVNKTGMREEAKLSIVSKFSEVHIGQFIDLNEIKKKL